MTILENNVIIASDTCERNGMGVEIYQDNKLIIEIFRDDSKRTRIATLFQKDISLDVLEESIQTFKNKIPWDFIEVDNLK